MATATKPARKPELTVSLCLAIDHAVYAVTPIRPEDRSIARAWRLAKKSDATAYAVAQTPHGATCDCGDQTFRHEGLDSLGCKHIRALRKVGLLDLGAFDVAEPA